MPDGTWCLLDVSKELGPVPLERAALRFNSFYPHWMVGDKRLVVKTYVLDYMIPNNRYWFEIKDFLGPLGLISEKYAVSQSVQNLVGQFAGLP